jgi:hypothetical protein
VAVHTGAKPWSRLEDAAADASGAALRAEGPDTPLLGVAEGDASAHPLVVSSKAAPMTTTRKRFVVLAS